MDYVLVLCSFLWMNNSSLYVYTTCCLSLHLLMDIWVISTFWLKWIVFYECLCTSISRFLLHKIRVWFCLSNPFLFGVLSFSTGHTFSFYNVYCVQLLSRIQLFVTCWAPLSMEFSRQQYWSGLPVPSPRDLSSPGIEPRSLTSPVLADKIFTITPPGKLIYGI